MYFSIVTLLLIGAVQSVLLPKLQGTYAVASRVQDLTDVTRLDPSAPAESPTLRRILISLFFPLDTSRTPCSPETVPYLPPETTRVYSQQAPSMGLPADFLGSFEVDYCNLSRIAPCKRSKTDPEFPVAIFSPGHTVSRLLYTALARNLASRGYVVITVDHPYDADVVEFPDGTVIRGNSNTTTDSQILDNLKVRMGDISFILDQLQNRKLMRHLTRGYPHRINVRNITAFGHSLGGAAAAAAMLSDSRIKGGLDLDGEIYGPVVSHGLGNPFVLVGSAANNGSTGLKNWAPFWERLRDTKMQLSIFNTTHLSFLDIPFLITVSPIPEELEPLETAVFGKIDGDLVQTTINGILTAFLGLLFGGQAEPLCDLGHRFPAVSIDKFSLPQPLCN